MKKIFILIAMFIASKSNAQFSCKSEDVDSANMTKLPWFGNNDWLNNFVDSIELPFNCTNCRLGDGPTKTLYQIPINAVVYDDVNYPNISNAQVEQYINYVNNLYKDNGVLIHFYLKCAIKRMGMSNHANIDDYADNGETGIVLASDNETDCINVHFVNDAPYNGKARYPWMSLKYSCIVRTKNGFTFETNDFRETLAHELGHCLGLPHTFNNQFTPVTGNCRTNCFQECVSRTRTQEGYCFFTAGKKKCEVNGDCFCDTHADIKDGNIQTDGSTNGNYNGEFANCITNNGGTYNISSTNTLTNCLKYDTYGDQWYPSGTWYGVPFTNAMNNIMSYWACGDKFTKMQRGAMYIYSTKKGAVPLNNNSVSFYSNIDVDNYENDNLFHPTTNFTDVNDNWMTVNTRQYHTFHHNFNSTTACDVDWVYFINQLGTQNQYVIQTSAVAGKPNPDTKITLYVFNLDGTLGAQIATNDDIASGTNLFSKITATLNSFNYALKIENKVTNVSDNRSKGHYYLRIDKCYDKTNVAIVGSNSICSGSQQYSVSNLPVGATVTWQATGCATVNSAGLVTKTGDCKTTLKAIISACGETYEVTRDIIVGLPVFGDAGNVIESDSECSGGSNAQCYSVNPNGSISWTTSTNMSNFTSVSWSKVYSIPANPGGSIIWSSNATGTTNGVNVHFKSANKHLALKTMLTNTCGSVEKYYCFYSTTEHCPAPMMMMMSGGNQTLKVYPNPTSAGNIITLELFLEEEQIDFENSTIQLIDSKNEVVFEKLGAKEMKEQLKIPSINNGTYYISVTNMNGTVSEELIIYSGQ